MNWREHPQLFANGKFRIKNDYGYNSLLTASELGMQLMRDKSKHNLVGLKDKKLIARPISDMSDDETFNLFEIAPIGHPDDFDVELNNERDRKFVRENCRYVTEGFLYLLSIGVYPFDDETDVIWRYENE